MSYDDPTVVQLSEDESAMVWELAVGRSKHIASPSDGSKRSKASSIHIKEAFEDALIEVLTLKRALADGLKINRHWIGTGQDRVVIHVQGEIGGQITAKGEKKDTQNG